MYRSDSGACFSSRFSTITTDVWATTAAAHSANKTPNVAICISLPTPSANIQTMKLLYAITRGGSNDTLLSFVDKKSINVFGWLEWVVCSNLFLSVCVTDLA
ncbi:hypothetical protein JG688_00003323 [Phytophthora aleatoria]|uniref:Uncharacterized protein n=1 Tax=Phytophthora aleatoria TaxID=2496075 RepID=A0A8J5J374_9STRA|nr:hypothetical protein JG688_00003323 [Phytophthora aleatoria]